MNKLESVIPIGKENAIHQEELAKRLSVKPAVAKLMVRQARQQGLEICSGTQGYWLAENDIERKEFVNMMRKQALSRLKSAKPINSTLNTINGQISLTDAIIEASEGGTNNEQE